MKYLSLFKKYLFVFVGAVLFGLAAVKLKAAGRDEKKATDQVRKDRQNRIEGWDVDIQTNLDSLEAKQNKAKEAKTNATKRLDEIAKNSGSVGSLLDEYNRNRV